MVCVVEGDSVSLGSVKAGVVWSGGKAVSEGARLSAREERRLCRVGLPL